MRQGLICMMMRVVVAPTGGSSHVSNLTTGARAARGNGRCSVSITLIPLRSGGIT